MRPEQALAMPRDFTVTVAPNGARRTKADHPALPVRIEEIADTAVSCFQAGASAIHLHIRDRNGKHSLDAGRYRETIAAVAQAAPRMDIQVTTEAAGVYDVPAQFDCLRQLCPKAASVSVREMTRNPQTAGLLYAFAQEASIDLQHICYDLRDIATLRRWQQAGMVNKASNSVLFVLGRYQPEVLAKPRDLDPFLRQTAGWRRNWSVCAFGLHEAACLHYAVKSGGNVRTGFENNIHLPNGALATDNAELVRIACRLGRSTGSKGSAGI
jgi:uncharacterized protein (DUF849 family)